MEHGFSFLPLHTRILLRAARIVPDAISLPRRKEMAKEKTPKALPLETVVRAKTVGALAPSMFWRSVKNSDYAFAF